jgi:hypothetical protein
MAEFFKGFKDLFDRRPEEEKKFDRMLEDYRKGDTQGHRNVAEGIDLIMLKSPDLKARTLEAIREGYVRSYSDTPVIGAGAASYQVSDGSIRVAPRFDHTDGAYMETMFMLGHETEHARSMKGVNFAATQLVPEIERIARSDAPLPRDYTAAIDTFAERTRAEEGRAHIGGFNAIASYIINDKHPQSEHLLRDLYEAHPGRMGDFIEKTSANIPATYALKAGLALGRDGLMPYNEQNIDAMKVYYADKAQLGAPHMNYRQEAIEFGSGMVKHLEQGIAESRMVDRDYIIDPVRLQAHDALGLPGDGRLQAKGAIQILQLDLGDLGPIMIHPAAPQPQPPANAPAVRLEPQQGDHPLFAQALTAVVDLHRRDKLTDDPQELRNLAAALSVSAHERGLHRIDTVTLSQDSTGMIASQGDGSTGINARVEGIRAMATPENVHLARLPAIEHVPSQPGPSPAQGLSHTSDAHQHK